MAIPHVAQRRWTVDEYYRMAETGVLQEGERVELIDGEIVRLSPQDWLHSTSITLSTGVLSALFRPPYYVRVQLPLDASPHSQPEPDFAVINQAMLTERPHPKCPLLVLEVAQSSLAYDRGFKSHLYASQGVPEYWVLNVLARQLEVFTEVMPDDKAPFGFRYRRQSVWDAHDTVQPLFAPHVAVPIVSLLPPLPTD